jgi:hypothetical protein
VDAAVPDAVVELGEDDVGAVDLVTGGGEVLADRAEFGAPVIGVFQQPGGVRLVGVVAGAGVFAQLVFEMASRRAVTWSMMVPRLSASAMPSSMSCSYRGRSGSGPVSGSR